MKNKKAFTLVEMLIVVVIIWILAAALIPRLLWAQAQARDTSRVVWISNISNWIKIFYDSNWNYPETTQKSVDEIFPLLKWILSSIPNDPQNKRTKIADTYSNTWYWAYSSLESISGLTWYWIFANVENIKKSNTLYSPNVWNNNWSSFDIAKTLLENCNWKVYINWEINKFSWRRCQTNAEWLMYASFSEWNFQKVDLSVWS